jgi:hypothetical protein
LESRLNAAQSAQTPEINGQAQEATNLPPETANQAPDAKKQKAEIRAQPAEDIDEDAETATKPEDSTVTENTAPPAPDDEGYVWPDGAEIATEAIARLQEAPASAAAAAPLPPLDELVKRIPADVRDTYDDLFRPKFVSVKRVVSSSLKS